MVIPIIYHTLCEGKVFPALNQTSLCSNNQNMIFGAPDGNRTHLDLLDRQASMPNDSGCVRPLSLFPSVQSYQVLWPYISVPHQFYGVCTSGMIGACFDIFSSCYAGTAPLATVPYAPPTPGQRVNYQWWSARESNSASRSNRVTAGPVSVAV